MSETEKGYREYARSKAADRARDLLDYIERSEGWPFEWQRVERIKTTVAEIIQLLEVEK